MTGQGKSKSTTEVGVDGADVSINSLEETKSEVRGEVLFGCRGFGGEGGVDG